ncbi:MAG: hypothetical protein GY750_06705 [Lentisphaerae bacterium]|nr:hypothetical protein [Lentisphaerota bacterium]MCP4101099.1 hypothetical protein [Lentisphaerota bacterium]
MAYYSKAVFLEFEREYCISLKAERSQVRLESDLEHIFEERGWAQGKNLEQLQTKIIFKRKRKKLPGNENTNHVPAYMLSFDVKKHEFARKKVMSAAFEKLNNTSKIYIHAHCSAGSDYVSPRPVGYYSSYAKDWKIHYKELARWIAEATPGTLRGLKSRQKYSRRPTIHFISCSAGKESTDSESFAAKFVREMTALNLYYYVIAYDITAITSTPFEKDYIRRTEFPAPQYDLNDFYPQGRNKNEVVMHGINAAKSNKNVFFCMDNSKKVIVEEYRHFFLNSSNFHDSIEFDINFDLRLHRHKAAKSFVLDNDDNSKKNAELVRGKIFAYRMRKPHVDPMTELLLLLKRKGNYFYNGQNMSVSCKEKSLMTYLAGGIHGYAKSIKSLSSYKPGHSKRGDMIIKMCKAVLRVWSKNFEYSSWNRNITNFKNELLKLG